MYKQIDIHVGPTLVVAKLVKQHVCSCKHPMISTGSLLGKRYDADLKSTRWVKFQCFGCGKKQIIRVIDVWSELLIPQWFPLAMLDIDARIPITAKPENWEPVKDNLVAPAHRAPVVRTA